MDPAEWSAGQDPPKPSRFGGFKLDSFKSPFGALSLDAFNTRPLGDTPALHSSIATDNWKVQGDFDRHGDTFNIHRDEAKSGLEAAQRLSVHRESRDQLRYTQG